MALGGLLLAALPAAAGIVGSSHDLSGETWSDGEVCSPCHTPHNAGSTTGAPLWNHDQTTATYTTYTSTTMVETVGTPGPESLVCLGCHDGTIALDSYGGMTGTSYIAGDADLGTDLSDDHPIGMGVVAAHGVELTTSCTNCHNTHGAMEIIGPVPFPDGQVECVSCHDVHDYGGHSGMLVMDNAGSALCLHCHGK